MKVVIKTNISVTLNFKLKLPSRAQNFMGTMLKFLKAVEVFVGL